MPRGAKARPLPQLDAATRALCEAETVRLLPLIEKIARRSKLPLPLEDLVQEGAIAVFTHRHKFDPSRGAKVETWLTPRIWGAMQDYARRVGRMLSGNGRAERHDQVRSLQAFRIEGDNGKEQRLEYAIEDRPGPKRGDWQHLLRGFNQRERTMLLSYFVLGHTMQRIGRDLEISESRVSQQMTVMLERLRAAEAASGRVREALCA